VEESRSTAGTPSSGHPKSRPAQDCTYGTVQSSHPPRFGTGRRCSLRPGSSARCLDRARTAPRDRLAAQKEAYISGRITGVAILYASDVLGREPINCQIGGCALLAAACVVERAFPSALSACTGKYVPTRGNPTNGTADDITLSKSECKQRRGRKELFLRNLCKIWRVNDAYGRKRFQAALRAPGWVADPPASLPR
jgi:hypothetical protein